MARAERIGVAPVVAGLLVTGACSSRDLGVVVSEGTAGARPTLELPPDAGSVVPNAEGCIATGAAVPIDGSYRVESVSALACLGVGALGSMSGFPIYEVAFDASCRSDVPALSWELSAMEGGVQLLNRETEYALDVRRAGTSPGVSLILFSPTGNQNQTFLGSPRGDGLYALSPQNASTMCVTHDALSAAIQPCDTSDPHQAWRFVRSDCP